ncbi:hypothetical protein H0A61_01828 [Koleobacter methoxysyntrophicus]|jgi:hypothetical protein|uniref:Helicase HerA central domain-containing protein n=1 Tax=Koleobacter methoxysyntrophicus TaxID=2751313 RepID=A0A8A0RM33_9FIRM|nr:DUF87 domain-containing protein [Koleobacter methoxysyntrophicus]QSQ09465.1 hypothetical protein H0A61_01828 [Koleobacter methoxysyntrophicus]
MNQTPFEHAGSLCIGTVDFVSPDEIKVLLDIEAPESVALNAGGPRPFPRVNSYVLMPVDDGYLVGQIEWITVERSEFPKRRGMQDFGLVDLPFPLRKMSLNPLGTLRKKDLQTEEYIFRRGADALPSIGTTVLLPTERQLRAIVESGEQRRVKIGTSPLAGDADVWIDPDRLFGRHLAVLGNTGSGKSCSVAGLIRWSLEAAQEFSSGSLNARFIILDPNGEYSRAFSDAGSSVKAQIFKVAPDAGAEELPLQVPLWFWNSAEWSSFTQATDRAQRPLLQQALRFRRNSMPHGQQNTLSHDLLVYLQGAYSSIRQEVANNAPFGTTKDRKYWGFIDLLKSIAASLRAFMQKADSHQESIKTVLETLDNLKDVKCKNERNYNKPFDYGDVDEFLSLLHKTIKSLGGSDAEPLPISEDVPIPFCGDDFLADLNFLATNSGNRQWFDFFLVRVRTMLNDPRMSAIVSNKSAISLAEWLSNYIGEENANSRCISVLDLSLVPTEIVHIITAVIARMVFEALQRYRELYTVSLPTVLVMEEAHTFIKRYKEDAENHDAASVCCQVFERIAREGRKFGLGLVLSSQRPSELSPAVLSQCNSFLLHRITNDRDQELVHRFVPDNLRGLLRELPSLPSQSAILLGWATELPVLVKMRDLPKSQQPRSDDPDFWNVWVGQDEEGRAVERRADWKSVAEEWQGTARKVDPTDAVSEGKAEEE